MGDIITNWYSLLAQFFNRLKGKPGSITSPSYEISMILVSIVILPVSLVYALIFGLLIVSIINLRINKEIPMVK
jgi:hypothetical protein